MERDYDLADAFDPLYTSRRIPLPYDYVMPAPYLALPDIQHRGVLLALRAGTRDAGRLSDVTWR